MLLRPLSKESSLLTQTLDNYEQRISDSDRETSAQRRRITLEAKLLHRSGNPGVGSAVPLQELQTIQATQGFGAPSQRVQVPHCTIYYECRRSDCPRHIDQMLGTGVIFFPETSTMLCASSLRDCSSGSFIADAEPQPSDPAS